MRGHTAARVLTLAPGIPGGPGGPGGPCVQRSGWSVLSRASPSLLAHPCTPGGLSLFSWATAGSRTFRSRFLGGGTKHQARYHRVHCHGEPRIPLPSELISPRLDFFTTRPCSGSCSASLLPLKLYPQQWPSTTPPVTSLTISSVACCLLPRGVPGSHR